MSTDANAQLLNQLRPRTSVPSLQIRSKPRIGSRHASERASKKSEITSPNNPNSPCASLPSPTFWRDTTVRTDCYNLEIQEQLISEIHQLQIALETTQERTNRVLTDNEALHVRLTDLQEINGLLERDAEQRLHGANIHQDEIISSLQSRISELSSEVDQLRTALASAVLDLDLKSRDESCWQELVHQLREEKSALEMSLKIRDNRLLQKECQVNALNDKAEAAAQYHKFVIQEMMLKQQEHGQRSEYSHCIDQSSGHSAHGRSLSLDAAINGPESLSYFVNGSSEYRCARADKSVFSSEPMSRASLIMQSDIPASLATHRQSCIANEVSLGDELSVLGERHSQSGRIHSIIASHSEDRLDASLYSHQMAHTSSPSLPILSDQEQNRPAIDARPHTADASTETTGKMVLVNGKPLLHDIDASHAFRGRKRVSQHKLYSVRRQSFLRFGAQINTKDNSMKNKYTTRPCSTGSLLPQSSNETDDLARKNHLQRSRSLSRLQDLTSAPPTIAELELPCFTEQSCFHNGIGPLLQNTNRPLTPVHQQSLEIKSLISPREPRPADAYISSESMPRPNSVAVCSLSTSRSSSIAIAEEAPVDPMSEKITQCLIGSEMYKYVRHKRKSRFAVNWGRSNDEQTVRHRRFVLLKPTDLTICWGLNRPMSKTLGLKKYVIDEVHDVEDHSPIPANTMMHKRSLIILSRGTALKFTCKDAPTHDLWYEVVTHLLRSRKSSLDKAIASIGSFTPIKVPERLPKASRPSSIHPTRQPKHSVSLASLRTYAQKTSGHARTKEDVSAHTILRPWPSQHHIYRARNYSAPAQHDALRASVPLATMLDDGVVAGMDEHDGCSEGIDRRQSIERFVVNGRPSAPSSSDRRMHSFTFASLFR